MLMEQRDHCHIPELQSLSQVQSYLPESKIRKIIRAIKQQRTCNLIRFCTLKFTIKIVFNSF